MAVYSKLLLSAGGGVISSQQQADQAKNTASVLIGLGGTGIDCLRTIKTQVRARLKPDDPEADVATYAHIRFLGVDTAEARQGDMETEDDPLKADSMVALDDTEFFSIANPNVKKAFANELALKQRPELDWLNWEHIAAPDLGKAGAGGIRQVGRYMMMDKSGAFLSRIQQEIDAAKSGLAQPVVNIHIFSGLSGGTGAGCFLDVCYMVRHIAEKVGGVTIFGYFFLPDVNLSKIPFADTKTRAFIPKNGYAAMQELDYCMQLQFNGGSFVQEYQNHLRIEWKTGPVDMCHLICATDSANNVIPNAYDYAMSVVTEYVMDFLTRSNNSFDLSQQLANFRQKVRTADGQKTIGSYLGYCIIGASCASIPLREINTYLASELFARFAQIRDNTPSKADVEQLAIRALARDAQNVSEIYNSLFREIREGAGDDYAVYPDDWKFVRDYGNADLITSYTDQTAAKLNRLEANAKSMITPENSESLLQRIRTRLKAVLTDIDRGPIYAYRMLSAAESHNLLNVVDGLITENDARWDQEAAQGKLRLDDYHGARADFNNRHKRSFLDNDDKRFNDYEYFLCLLEQHKLSLRVYEKLDEVLHELRRQLVDVTAGYYLKLSRVMETLINTFRENSDALKSERMLQTKGAFVTPMMTIAELKKTLDEEIARINIPNMMDAFMLLLVDHEDDWLMEDEGKISKLVTKFFVDTAFSGFANRTITAFLKAKYNIDNDERLANRVYVDWMKMLTAKARPLFYFNESIWQDAQTSRLSFLSIPTSSAPIKAAAQKMYETDNQWAIKESELTDRIYVMCSACALPLSAYNNCGEYERAFFSTTEGGRHYYEGKPVPGMRFDDWNKLPSLTPQSVLSLDDAPDLMREQVTAAQQLYEEADALGVFSDSNQICRPREESVRRIQALTAQCRDLAGQLARAEDLPAAKQLLEELSAALEGLPMDPTSHAMANDGFAGKLEVKNSVRKDHFVDSPIYQMEAREIVGQLKSLRAEAEEAISALDQRMSKVSDGGRDINNFCDALFTGVISMEGVVLTYRRVQFGFATEIVLSKRGDEFPLSAIPVYQGLLSYQALDQDTKAEIKHQVDDRFNEGSPEILASGKKLKEILTGDRVNAWAQLAANYEQHRDILEFLGTLQKQFGIFCLGNGI